jgi:hypothetical protein
MHARIIISLLLIAAILLVGCVSISAPAPVTPTPSASHIAVEKEALRLGEVALDRNLSIGDFSTLENLTQDDAALRDEVVEAEWMVEHQLPQHAGHSLNAIASIARDGKYVCPADSLSHVRVYLDYNESALATDALQQGKETLHEWETIARAAKQKNAAAYPGLEEVINQMDLTIRTFEQGDYNAARAHAAYLEAHGYC